jgi:outer membrane protein, heavy metal efflux system
MLGAPRPARLAAAVAICLAALYGCALQSYHAAPIDAQAGARRFESRTSDSPALREYMLAHGYTAAQWPLERWGLTELTLAAFYDHPDIEVARAQAKALRAEGTAAVQRMPLGITPRVEHHSLRTEDQSSPWSLGFEVQIPLSFASTGEAIRNRYEALAQAAELKVGATAWEIRSRVRAGLLDVYANRAEAELLANEVRERETLFALLEQRMHAGAISAAELSSAQLAMADAKGRLQIARAGTERNLATLAEALSLPLSAARSMRLDYDELQRLAPVPQNAETQRAALLNRVDIRGKLLEYAAAEAAVQLEIARQYPTISISPGFLWDQGDNVWSLAATLIPAVLGNRPAISAAQARRAVEAAQFRALQDRVIAQAQGAEAAYASLAQALAQSEQAGKLAAARVQQIERQFAAGYADRVELTTAHLDSMLAQRSALAVRLEALRAQGILEDALQIPLAGGPLPQPGGSPDRLTGLARQ